LPRFEEKLPRFEGNQDQNEGNLPQKDPPVHRNEGKEDVFEEKSEPRESS